MNTVTKSVQYVESSVEPEDWEKLGLPGLPIRNGGNGPVVPASQVLRDHRGDPALGYRSISHVRSALTKRFECKFDVVFFVTDREAYHAFRSTGIPPGKDFTAGVAGFAPADGRVLSIPDRAAAVAIVDVFNNFMFSTPRSESYNLSAIFARLEEDGSDSPKVIPHKADTESKAFQLAAVAEHLLNTPVDIVADDGGYFIVATHCKGIEGSEALVKLSHACELLYRFDIMPGECDLNLANTFSEGLPIARRIADRYNAQRRIEDGISAILAHLGHSEVTGKGNVPVTEQSPATPLKRRGIESLIPSGKPSKKSSAKSA